MIRRLVHPTWTLINAGRNKAIGSLWGEEQMIDP